MTRKLPKDAFYAQFHNHEHHLEAQDHERLFSHEVPDHPSSGKNPDYSRNRHKRDAKKAVSRALHLTIGN